MEAGELTPSPQGEALYRELLWVHRMIRRDLDAVRTLAREVEAGLEPAELNASIASLRANGPLWQLKVNCLGYCRFVHSHHRLEDVALFPALRRTNPAIAPVVDRLESDHRQVASLLGEVEAAAEALAGEDGAPGRELVVRALGELADVLLAHLEFEEREVATTMRAMSSPPGPA